jgi:hypothetical protein
MGLGPSTSSLQSELKLEPESLAILTSQRDLALKHKQDERREWYAQELGRCGSEVEAHFRYPCRSPSPGGGAGGILDILPRGISSRIDRVEVRAGFERERGLGADRSIDGAL